jgi:hypothetical protein
MSEEQLQLLNQAKERAERLVGEMQSQCAEVEADPQLRQGRAAMQNVIAAAQRTAASLEAAISTSPKTSD